MVSPTEESSKLCGFLKETGSTQTIFLVALPSVLLVHPVFGLVLWGLSVLSWFPVHFCPTRVTADLCAGVVQLVLTAQRSQSHPSRGGAVPSPLWPPSADSALCSLLYVTPCHCKPLVTESGPVL